MSKLANPFFYVVQIPLYRQNVMFSINQTDDQFLNSILKASSVWRKGQKRSKADITYLLDAFADMSPSVDARTVLYTSGIIAVRLWDIDLIYKPANLATFTHELFHVISFIASQKGLQLNSGSEEAYSYLTGFITEEFFNMYQKKIKYNGSLFLHQRTSL